MSSAPESTTARQLLDEFLAPMADVGFDFGRAIVDEAFLERVATMIADDAEILFVVPSGGFVGDMAGPWTGPEGFVAGWNEWLGGFDDFRIATDEMLAPDERTALALVTSFARLRGSEAVIEQKAAAVYRSDGSRFTRIEFYLDQDQARRAAGLP